jgi:two-component system response regulator AtoC
LATILVVDDDPLFRSQADALLSDLGHEVVLAANGEAGLAQYDVRDPDLVVTDIVMPAMNGVLLIEQILSVYPEARVIAITGKDPAQLQRAKIAGAAAVLRKPIDGGQFIAEVERLLKLDRWGA